METLFVVVLSVDQFNQTLVLNRWQQHWSRNFKLLGHPLILRDESLETESIGTRFKLTLLISATGVPNQSDKSEFKLLTAQLFELDNLSGEDDILPQTLVEWRVYKKLELGAKDLPAPHTRVFVLVAMTPQPSTEQDFNDWYIEEHIPLLSRVPGWISSHRFLLLSSSVSAPQYLALHEWESTISFETDEYILATNTPWRTEVMREIIQKERHVLICTGQS